MPTKDFLSLFERIYEENIELKNKMLVEKIVPDADDWQ